LPEGNSRRKAGLQAQDWADYSYKLDRVREAAERDEGCRFTTLLHHITPRLLMDSFDSLKKDAASGVDDLTWIEYKEGLAHRLLALHDRVHGGRYRAKPSKRIYIPKANGQERPIGIASLEDKIVQRAVGRILEMIYEVDFLGFSYGFRPGRSQHNALDAVSVGLERRKINWVLDADLASFFDTISHEWLLKFLAHRIADPRILRLVEKWLKAGVSEDGKRSRTTVGTPQGAVISPLLANIFLHYVLDLWTQQWREKHVVGDMIIVRYADDFIVGFHSRSEAERYYQALQERLVKFGLSLQKEKTRIIEFGRFATKNRKARGAGKPETFDFLGFTHICGETKKNKRFTVRRKPMAKRLRSKLKEMKVWIMKDRHKSVSEQGQKIRDVINGVFQYYAVPGTIRYIGGFRTAVRRYWRHALRRRSQKYDSKRIKRKLDYWFPPARILHPYPDQRLRV